MSTSRYTEEEIAEIVDKLDEDFGLLVGLWMNKHESDGVDIKVYDPDGTADRFEIRRITALTENEGEWGPWPHHNDPEKWDGKYPKIPIDKWNGIPPVEKPNLDKDGCVYWDHVLENCKDKRNNTEED